MTPYQQGQRDAFAKYAGSRGKLLAKEPSTSKREYSIRAHPDGHLTCSCGDYKYRQAETKGECKHIKAHKEKQARGAPLLRENVKVAISWGAPTPAAPRPETRLIGPMRKPTGTMQRIMEAARDQAYERGVLLKPVPGRLMEKRLRDASREVRQNALDRPDAQTLNKMWGEGSWRRMEEELPPPIKRLPRMLGEEIRGAVYGGVVRYGPRTLRTMPADTGVKRGLLNDLTRVREGYEGSIPQVERRIADPRFQRVIERYAPGGVERIKQHVAAARGEAPVPAFDIKKLRGGG